MTYDNEETLPAQSHGVKRNQATRPPEPPGGAASAAPRWSWEHTSHPAEEFPVPQLAVPLATPRWRWEHTTAAHKIVAEDVLSHVYEPCTEAAETLGLPDGPTEPLAAVLEPAAPLVPQTAYAEPPTLRSPRNDDESVDGTSNSRSVNNPPAPLGTTAQQEALRLEEANKRRAAPFFLMPHQRVEELTDPVPSAESSHATVEADDGHQPGETETVFRLVRFTAGGLQVADRRGYGRLADAREAAAGELEEYAVSSLAIKYSDILIVDGVLVNDAAKALDYEAKEQTSGANWTFLYTTRTHGTVGTVVPETVPQSWIGKAYVKSDGSGQIWTTNGMRRLEKYRFREQPGTEPVFFWSVAANAAWKRRVNAEEAGNGPELLPVTAEEATAWQLPKDTRLLLLTPAPDGRLDALRNAVPATSGAIEALLRQDPFKGILGQKWYRVVRLSTEGWKPTSTEVHSTKGGAESEATKSGWWPYQVVVMVNGLGSDVESVDGTHIGAGPVRTKPDRVAPVAWGTGAAGRAELDANGNGYVFDGTQLIEITDGCVAKGQWAPAGLPAWVYGALRSADTNPLQANVQGVIVRIDAEKRREYHLDDEVRAALISRRSTRRHQIYARPLTLNDLRSLETDTATPVDIGERATPSEVPEGIFPRKESGE